MHRQQVPAVRSVYIARLFIVFIDLGMSYFLVSSVFTTDRKVIPPMLDRLEKYQQRHVKLCLGRGNRRATRSPPVLGAAVAL
eukprot:m.450517 g.450517  ORF g.450517 m.450517 type:complete len:82 (-) comp21512_c0_seq25:2125-2370(-)